MTTENLWDPTTETYSLSVHLPNVIKLQEVYRLSYGDIESYLEANLPDANTTEWHWVQGCGGIQMMCEILSNGEHIGQIRGSEWNDARIKANRVQS